MLNSDERVALCFGAGILFIVTLLAIGVAFQPDSVKFESCVHTVRASAGDISSGVDRAAYLDKYTNMCALKYNMIK